MHEEHDHIHDHHDHDHNHEHTHTHDHEHTHADGTTHSHPHEHAHDHHSHAHGEGKPIDELVALMKYMTEHNAAHTHELEDLAHEVQHAGQNAAHDDIMKAVRFFNQGNEALRLALSKLQENA
ncbi:MAG: cobalt transporter [Clostridia bacterium]|nr:cobalt transporter [Clostridia bacterium]